MKHSELKRAAVVVPSSGGDVAVLTAEGQVLAEVGFPGGIHPLAVLAEYFGPECTFDPVGVVFVSRGVGRAMRIVPPSNRETGANPDFRPQTLSPGEQVLQRAVRALQGQVQAQAKRIETALKQAKAERPMLVEEEEAADDAPEPELPLPAKGEPAAAE